MQFAVDSCIPRFKAVTRPFSSTVATLGSLDVNVIPIFSALTGIIPP
ncbi:MAG: hypothetical protein RRY79_05665 [Clostridia bacterium]